MSNGKGKNIWERLFKLWAMICKMIMDGLRDPHMVAEALQKIVDQKIYLRRLFTGEVFRAGDKTVFLYEVARKGTYANFFESLGSLKTLSRHALSDAEISKFCHAYRGKVELAQEMGGIAFLTKRGNYLLVTQVGFEKKEGDTFCFYDNGLNREDIFSHLWLVTPVLE